MVENQFICHSPTLLRQSICYEARGEHIYFGFTGLAPFRGKPVLRSRWKRGYTKNRSEAEPEAAKIGKILNLL